MAVKWLKKESIEMNGNLYWEAKAECADGATIERLFAYNEYEDDDEQQYDIECWLINRANDLHGGVIWYSVTCVVDD